MPAKRELSMRQLRTLLRLHHGGVSAREIGRRLGVARSTIQDNLKRAAAAGLAWPLADDVTDEALELRLFGRAGTETGQRRRVEPDWAALARELKRPGVTMMILWEEYREINQDGYGYSRFCDLLRGFERRLSPGMRQHHVAGEKAFVDYSGKRIAIIDPTTGEIRSSSTDDIACWFIDTNYNGESFFVRHAYFTGADQPYEKLKRALRAEIDEAAWSALYSTASRPFDPPATGKIAVKVINHYGDEVMKVYGID